MKKKKVHLKKSLPTKFKTKKKIKKCKFCKKRLQKLKKKKTNLLTKLYTHLKNA